MADWLASSPAFASDVAAQGVGVRSYVRSLGTAVLLSETLDPLASGISPDDAWSSVRNRVLLRAATSTDAAIATWACSFTYDAALACGANAALGATKGKVVAIVPAGPLSPGTVAVSKILGAPWAVHDHGELLIATGGKAAQPRSSEKNAASRAGQTPCARWAVAISLLEQKAPVTAENRAFEEKQPLVFLPKSRFMVV